MNIQNVKHEIKRTFRAYTQRDEEDFPYIQTSHQRPVLLIGPPGIGKTAIMEQIAAEEHIGLVSYTMTHHTRQSAVGLPLVREQEYQGRSYSITEYTMSEIVASIYDYMERTGITKGILFIDEINCVSETLAPVMLQLLQNKTFGNHRIPRDWLIVAAGNPPEYNKSVREFDTVTLDRVKTIYVEADLGAWITYAREKNIHPSVLAFLNLYPDSFYTITQENGFPSFVTARGWEDLSFMLYAYEREHAPVTEEFILQYLRSEGTARNFFLFYELFRSLADGLANQQYFSEEVQKKLSESVPAVGVAYAAILFSRISVDVSSFYLREHTLTELQRHAELFHSIKADHLLSGDTDESQLKDYLRRQKEAFRIKLEHDLLPLEEQILQKRIFRILEDIINTSCIHNELALSSVINMKIDKEREELFSSSRQLQDFISRSYQLINEIPQKICASFFSTDLSGNTLCRKFISENDLPVPVLEAL